MIYRCCFWLCLGISVTATGCGGCGGSGKITTSVSFSSNDEPAATQYRAPPVLDEKIDGDEVKREILDEFHKHVVSVNAESVVYGGYHRDVSGKTRPRRIEVGLETLPNSLLVTADYRLESLTNVNGTDITDAWKDSLAGTLSLRGFLDRWEAASINLPIELDQVAAGGKMTIAFDVKVPTRLEILRFAATDKPNAVKSGQAGRVTLKSLDETSATLQMELQSKTSPMVLAFDSTDGCLERTSETGMMGGVTFGFAGTISQLWVVTTVEITEVKTQATFDVAPVSMPDDPSPRIATRYDFSPLQPSATPDPVQWIKSKVLWNAEDKQLVLPFAGEISGLANNVDWQVHWFGKRAELLLPGMVLNHFPPTATSYRANTDDVDKATAAVGRCRLTLPGQFKTLTFEKKGAGNDGAGVWIEHPLPSGEMARVLMDEQIVTIDDTTTEMLGHYGLVGLYSVRARDESGRMLRFSHLANSPGGTRFYFWGTPRTVELVVAEETKTHDIPFELSWGKPDSQAFAKFTKDVSTRLGGPNPPDDWPWNAGDFAPDGIPDQAVEGTMAGTPFVAARVTITRRKGGGNRGWDVCFYSAEPEFASKSYDQWWSEFSRLMGKSADEFTEEELEAFRRMYYTASAAARSITLEIPDARAGVKLNVPVGSNVWNSAEALSFRYFRPRNQRFDGPDSDSSSWINIGIGSGVWLYFEITEWDETPSRQDAHIIGKAAGRIAVGSLRHQGETCRVRGAFTADIIVP